MFRMKMALAAGGWDALDAAGQVSAGTPELAVSTNTPTRGHEAR
ncbi:hypothetical protein [Myxococcus landrumensis]|nr:hypothetical protein [Myxococcus landrumus]